MSRTWTPAGSDRPVLRSLIVYGLTTASLLVILALLVSFVSVRTLDENQIEKETLLKMQQVEQAYKMYFLQNDAWPESPEVLVEWSADGRPPLLEGGPSAITSAWGTPFKVEVQLGGDSPGKVVVMTTDRKGNVLRWPRK